jgi:hypothetical protein
MLKFFFSGPQLSFVPPLLPTMLLTIFPTPAPTHNSAVMSSSTPPTCTNESPGDAAILASGELEIQVLEHATNLREVVEQLERGDVQQIHDKYSTQQGRAADQMWPRIKVTVNRHERLYHQLMDPSGFNGDKDRFFKFFMATHSMLARGRKQKANDFEGNPELVPYWLIVEAIPHRNKDIREEKGSTAYLDETNSFSSPLWHVRWGDANSWEIWRMLEKEYYIKKR